MESFRYVKELVLEKLPYEVIWLNSSGNLVYANEKFCRVMGYSKAEVTTLSIRDINITVTSESWDSHWDEVVRNGCVNFPVIHKTKSGKFYNLEIFAQLISYNNEEFICGVGSEITEASFYKNVIDNTKDIGSVGGWELNLQDGSIIVTSCALNIFHTLDSNDFLPSNIKHQFDDRQKVDDLFTQLIENGIAFDEIFETKESPPRYIRAIAKPILKGHEVFKISGVYQDITEIKQKENDLTLYKTIIDNAQDLIYVYNDKADLLHYSESLVEKLGFTKQELDRLNMFEIDPSLTPGFWKGHFKELREKGSHRLEWIITRKDGTKFPADITASHLKYYGEDFSCAVVRDITARKKHDLELYEALEEIKSLKERLENENEYLQEEISKNFNYNNILYSSASYKKVLTQVDQVAATDTTVLITGESGTGKELLASAIHSNSRRKNRPLIKINCATLPKELMESELFGHKKGAFTGAMANKMGKFSLADGGTIFLDEIGELPVDLQPKLLRVLQEGEFDELGGTKTIKVDVRIIAATNRDLKEMMREGLFREDLYYRLNVFPIYNIPLRARKDDIPLLAQYFLEKYSAKAGKSFKRLATKTIECLMNYNFPGNIRELENLIERAVIVENGSTLGPGNWIPKNEISAFKTDFQPFEEKQREYIIEVLEHTNWRISGPNGAAAILEMKDKTLFAKMKRLGIEKQVGLKSLSNHRNN
ncbi:sigma 54-interacting transcriptional regulator [Algoriphagus sp. AGSA1]|uniref:sigma 54-interacting transcriptional regulator n=1 Tax=Algoriphagus sp. AGSA1 TaxID=2907213 RepID=UPI001F3FBD0D|nr:sigma 54-interacting transcriptional regulator [Algoriphagus sp. AGSA1]MCE7054184.1 sigma 54-interacting transcriptional regulator [Algoriphagus sp. AGSA1]